MDALKAMGAMWLYLCIIPLLIIVPITLLVPKKWFDWFNDNSDIFYSLIIGMGFALFVSWLALDFIGFHKPDHFYETRKDYDTKLFVQVFPDKDSVKNYYLPADVSKVEGEYWVNAFYWPNGGKETFDSPNCTVSLDRKDECTTVDSDGNDISYYVLLTDKAAP